MADAEATRNFTIRNIITGHCGECLTPDRVDEIVNEIVAAMRADPRAFGGERIEARPAAS